MIKHIGFGVKKVIHFHMLPFVVPYHFAKKLYNHAMTEKEDMLDMEVAK